MVLYFDFFPVALKMTRDITFVQYPENLIEKAYFYITLDNWFFKLPFSEIFYTFMKQTKIFKRIFVIIYYLELSRE